MWDQGIREYAWSTKLFHLTYYIVRDWWTSEVNTEYDSCWVSQPIQDSSQSFANFFCEVQTSDTSSGISISCPRLTKQVRNLCVCSRPGDQVWPCAMNKVTGQIDSTQLTSDRCRQSASVQPAVVERTDRLYVAKGPSSSLLLPPPLFSQCEAHGPPIGVGREKNAFYSASTHCNAIWKKANLVLNKVEFWEKILFTFDQPVLRNKFLNKS